MKQCKHKLTIEISKTTADKFKDDCSIHIIPMSRVVEHFIDKFVADPAKYILEMRKIKKPRRSHRGRPRKKTENPVNIPPDTQAKQSNPPPESPEIPENEAWKQPWHNQLPRQEISGENNQHGEKKDQ